MRSWTVAIAELCPHSHFWSFGLVLSIEEFGESPSLDSVDGIVVKPGRVAGDDDVVGLFCHVVLVFLLPFGIILHSFLFTSILPYQLQYQKNTLGLFFLTLCRDHFTPTLGQKTYLVSSLLIHVHDGPTFDWLVLAVLVTTVTARCFNENNNVARKHFPFFLYISLSYFRISKTFWDISMPDNLHCLESWTSCILVSGRGSSMSRVKSSSVSSLFSLFLEFPGPPGVLVLNL